MNRLYPSKIYEDQRQKVLLYKYKTKNLTNLGNIEVRLEYLA